MDVWWSTLIFCIFYVATSIVDVTSVKVNVTQGWLEGELLDATVGGYRYYSFKGIPYARPPLGKLRFKAPQPPVPWNGLRNAKQHGAVCPHVDINTNEYIPGNEDCLFLNVYTPNLKPKSLLPIMFYIHGGGFRSGSGNTDIYGPDFLMNLDIVVVTINYRLDALGFLCLNTEEVPGNAGLKDQVAALKWVNQNIKHFGGDPNMVTIMGNSAGAASVVLHLASPMSAGLFCRASFMSGVPLYGFAIPHQPQMRPFILGKQLGYDTKDPNELLQYLQSLPVRKLVHTFPTIVTSEELMRDNRLKMNIFTPVVENSFGLDNFLTQSWSELLRNGFMNKADLLIGHANQESILFIDDFVKSYLRIYDRYPEMLVPRNILISSTPDTILEVSKIIREHYFGDKRIDSEVIREFVNYANDASFIYDIHKTLNILPKSVNLRKYFYIFACVSERNYYGKRGKKYGIHGAAHNDDLLYMFNANALNLTINENSREYALVKLTTKIVANFIKYGNPTPDYETLGFLWPEYNNVTKLYFHAGNVRTIKSHPDRSAAQFWNKIYDYAGLSL